MIERVRQLLQVRARPSEDELALARRLLTPELYALFTAQMPRDAVHGARCTARLLKDGFDDSALLQAGLLHDVAKGHQRAIDRAGYVLAARAGLAGAIAGERSRFELRRAFARTLHHSEASARTLERAGAPARAIDLTRRHHEPAGQDAMLAALQKADAAS